MVEQPIFTPIDLQNWPRQPYFEHYSQRVKCTYSMTVPIDITALLASCRAHSIKLYPAMIYIIATAINKIEELRIDYNEHKMLGVWNYRSPSYTIFHQENKTFSTLWTPYFSRFSQFYQAYCEDMARYGLVKTFFAKGQEPGNTFPISCIPWVDFTAFNLNIYDNSSYLPPIFTTGCYTYLEGKTVIPISAQLHHAVCDGYHAGLLFEKIKKLAQYPATWLEG